MAARPITNRALAHHRVRASTSGSGTPARRKARRPLLIGQKFGPLSDDARQGAEIISSLLPVARMALPISVRKTSEQGHRDSAMPILWEEPWPGAGALPPVGLPYYSHLRQRRVALPASPGFTDPKRQRVRIPARIAEYQGRVQSAGYQPAAIQPSCKEKA